MVPHRTASYQCHTCELAAFRGDLETHATVPDQRPPCTKKSATDRSGRIRTVTVLSSANSGMEALDVGSMVDCACGNEVRSTACFSLHNPVIGSQGHGVSILAFHNPVEAMHRSHAQ